MTLWGHGGGAGIPLGTPRFPADGAAGTACPLAPRVPPARGTAPRCRRGHGHAARSPSPPETRLRGRLRISCSRQDLGWPRFTAGSWGLRALLPPAPCPKPRSRGGSVGPADEMGPPGPLGGHGRPPHRHQTREQPRAEAALAPPSPPEGPSLPQARGLAAQPCRNLAGDFITAQPEPPGAPAEMEPPWLPGTPTGLIHPPEKPVWAVTQLPCAWRSRVSRVSPPQASRDQIPAPPPPAQLCLCPRDPSLGKPGQRPMRRKKKNLSGTSQHLMRRPAGKGAAGPREVRGGGRRCQNRTGGCCGLGPAPAPGGGRVEATRGERSQEGGIKAGRTGKRWQRAPGG